MSILQSIILGIVQGLTEFLPISSSAHLVIIPYLLGWEIDPETAFIFNILVQTASLIAVILYFRKDLSRLIRHFFKGIIERKPFQDSDSRLAWYIIVATIPAGIFGLIFKDLIEKAFGSILFVAIAWFITAIILASVEWVGKRNRSLDNLNLKDAIIIGLSQIIAVFPGLSRSGATISGGMIQNLDRPSAARFSFLMSIPVLLAAGFLTGIDLIQMENLNQQIIYFLPGIIASAIVSYFSIRWLIQYLMNRSLLVFSIYCVLMGFFVLTVYWWRK